MAITATEEALLRDLLAKQAQLIALANNETTITAKLGSTKATIDDLTAATTVNDADLLIVRQGGVDKKLPVSAVKSDLVDLSSYAPKASPDLTGTPTAPTAAAGTNTKQIATTEFVQSEKPSDATQAEMETGTEAAIRGMSPLRVAQAIAAKATVGGGRGQVFKASGTFTVPTGVTSVKVRGCGGGSGGGIIPGAGGTTSFGSHCSATGGNGATPGTGTGGDINLVGGKGGMTNAALNNPAAGGAVGGGYGGGGVTSDDFLAAPTGLLGGSGHPAAAATGYGNGGGAPPTSASQRTAGSAGGYFEKHITGLTPGSSITVTIGAAGTAGTDGKAGAPGICIVEW